MFRIFPDEYYDSIFHIDFDKLYEEGYRGLMFDIDNTLVPYDVEHPPKKVIDLFTNLKQKGFKICLVSNNNRERVYKFNEKLKLYAVPKALKPMTRNIRKALKVLGTETSNTAFIGDQIFTDVLAGNKVNLKTILVVPISEKEEWVSKIKRSTEKYILKMYEKKGK
jgi:HAD superfamily phosphatase (TIGR01668 family)